MDQRPLFEACLKLRNQSEFYPVRKYLEERLELAKDRLVTLPVEQVGIAQGRAQELKEFLDLIERSPSLLEQKR
jgi:hypothetical protein